MTKKKSKDLPEQAAEEQDATTPATEEIPAEGTPSALEAELAACRAEVSKNWDLYLRERADLENFRKRTQREKEERARFANENLLRESLPVIDNLERAIEHARQGEEGSGLLQGVEMTLSQLQKVLEKFGATPFVSVGEAFDPSRHEAMGQIETAEHAPNAVAQELQKGYLLHERLLRPALVMIAKAPAPSAAGDEAQADQE